MKIHFSILKSYLRPQRGRVIVLLLLLVCASGLALVTPRLTAHIIDSAMAGESMSILVWLTAAFIVLSLLEEVLRVSESYLANLVAWTATNSMRENLFGHCLHLDMRFHNRNSPGQLLERIDGDVAELEGFFSVLFIRLLSSALLLVGVLSLLFYINLWLGAAFLAFTLAAAVVLFPVRNISTSHMAAFREVESQNAGCIEETLTGREEIKTNGALPYALFQLEHWMYLRMQKARKFVVMSQVPTAITVTLYTSANILAVYSCYRLATAGLISIGIVYLILRYTNMLLGPIDRIVGEVTRLQRSVACLGRISDLLETRSSIEDVGSKTLTANQHSVTVKDVSFAYNDSETVLDLVSFDLAPGERLGIIGRTGSGKTTITRLLFRMFDSESGSIRIDGIDQTEIALHNLYGRIGLVTQEVQLFQSTLRENLRLFNPDVNDAALEAIIERIDLIDWFRQLPDGLETELTPGGGNISAGQAQLIGLARVFLKDPGIVILDEPTSRLDPVTEHRIKRVLADLMTDRTAIIIAHHLSTIEAVDKVLVLEAGAVVECGPRQALLEDPGSAYARLRQQSLATGGAP